MIKHTILHGFGPLLPLLLPLLYEREYILKFLLPSCLETGRVMEDKLWVALE
jgi:hypothetical protein